MKEVSIVLNFTNINSKTSFEEMMFSIRRGDYMDVILQLRKIYASGDKSAYEKAKKALLAFTPSATFNGRRLMQFMLNYSYIIVLDFDKLSPEELIRVKQIICLCPYTVACFVSPTGNGLKVFVGVKSEPEQHLQAFLSAQRYYTLLTGVPIDASGKDITRLCFVSWDPDLYYEPAAKVFDWEKGVELPGEGKVDAIPDNVNANEIGVNTDKRDVGMALVAIHGNEDRDIKNEEGLPQGPSLHHMGEIPQPIPVSPTGTENIFKIYKRCIRFIEKYIQYQKGQRHNFILKLALEIRKKGIPEITALFLIQQDYDLENREITNIVRDVYQFNLTNCEDRSRPVPTQENVSQQKESQLENQDSCTDRSRPIPTKANNPIDPDEEEIIFPLMKELDEIYYTGGEPTPLNETPD